MVADWSSEAALRLRFEGLEGSSCQVEEVSLVNLCHELLSFVARQRRLRVAELCDDFNPGEDYPR
jgi:hypothetical protein